MKASASNRRVATKVVHGCDQKGASRGKKKTTGNATTAFIAVFQNETYVKEVQRYQRESEPEIFGLEQSLGPTHDTMAKVSSGENKKDR